MYKIRHATGTYAYDAFFHGAVILGSYFILNLMVAVQSSYVSQSFQDPKVEENPEKEDKSANNNGNSAQDHTSDVQMRQSDQENTQKQLIIEPGESVGQAAAIQEEKQKKEKGCCYQLLKLQKNTRSLIEKAGFSICIIVLILANTLIMAIDHYNMDES